MLCSTLSLLCDPHCIMYDLSLWKSVSCWFTICIFSIAVHIFTKMLLACIFMLMPLIFWSLFLYGCSKITSMLCTHLSQLFYDVYSIFVNAMCMHNTIHCKYWHNMATSLWIIATNDMRSVMTHTSLAKQ